MAPVGHGQVGALFEATSDAVVILEAGLELSLSVRG